MDPTRSTGLRDSLLNEKKKKLVFTSFRKSVPHEKRFCLKSLLVIFILLRGKLSKNKKPLMTPVRMKRYAKHESGSGDQITYWEGTSCEVTPL